MPRVLPFDFPLPAGLHARPASALEEVARGFQAEVRFVNRANGREASAKSVLGLIATETQGGEACELRIAGGDEADASVKLERFLRETLPHCDDAAPPPVEGAARRFDLPRSLAAAGLASPLVGAAVAGGVGIGTLLHWGTRRREPAASSPDSPVPPEPAAEARRLDLAWAQAAAEIEREMREAERDAAGAGAAGVLRSHLALLRDPALESETRRRVAGGMFAAAALDAAAEHAAGPLRQAKSALVRERALDLEDVVERLQASLGGRTDAGPFRMTLSEPTIVAAPALSPGQFLALDRKRLKGLVLGAAGGTSHAAILARSFGIPTVAGLGADLALLRNGEEAIVDGDLGLIVPAPSASVRRYYERQLSKFDRLRRTPVPGRSAARGAGLIELAANIASGEEAAAALARGAQGIGLFRTEMLFLDRESAPGEEEQYVSYAAAARACAGRTLIVRTLDAGGDKPLPFLRLPAENNPFLGVRGVRWYAQHPEVIRTQFRALLRAAALAPLRAMIPMVSTVEEMRLCRRLLAEAREELRTREPAAAGAALPMGAMLEVPSVAFAMDELCAEAEFFSLGTNDLAQYFFAADRENPALADADRPFSPAFLRLLRSLTDAARDHHRWIGLCGEWGEVPEALPLLVAFGLHEVSVAAAALPALAATLERLKPEICSELLAAALAATDASAVRALLRLGLSAADQLPLIAPELIVLDADCASKEEVIRDMADVLQVTGRTDRPEAIEAAIWKREASYSTGFGDGFALPHCKSDDVIANSMVVVRLARPVGWQSVDDRPVDLAVLLAIRADHGREHLAALGRFSRLLTRPEFRASLRSEHDPVRLAELIAGGLAPAPH